MNNISTEPARITSSSDDLPDLPHELTGVSHTFRCLVSGNLTPEVTWYFNGVPLEGDEGRVISENELTVGPTMVSHSGMYQCFASNDNGVAYRSWTLQVREPGRVTMTSLFQQTEKELESLYLYKL